MAPRPANPPRLSTRGPRGNYFLSLARGLAGAATVPLRISARLRRPRALPVSILRASVVHPWPLPLRATSQARNPAGVSWSALPRSWEGVGGPPRRGTSIRRRPPHASNERIQVRGALVRGPLAGRVGSDGRLESGAGAGGRSDAGGRMSGQPGGNLGEAESDSPRRRRGSGCSRRPLPRTK